MIAELYKISSLVLFAVLAYALFRGYRQGDKSAGGLESCEGCTRRDCTLAGPAEKGGGETPWI